MHQIPADTSRALIARHKKISPLSSLMPFNEIMPLMSQDNFNFLSFPKAFFSFASHFSWSTLFSGGKLTRRFWSKTMPNLFIVRSATEWRPAGESCEDNWWWEKSSPRSLFCAGCNVVLRRFDANWGSLFGF